MLNGVTLAANQDNFITAAQLAQLSYQVGSGTDMLWIRANDGTVWGDWSTPFTVTATSTVGVGATLELPSAYSGTISFAGATGTLKIDKLLELQWRHRGSARHWRRDRLRGHHGRLERDNYIFRQQFSRRADSERWNAYRQRRSPRQLFAWQLHGIERWSWRNIGCRPPPCRAKAPTLRSTNDWRCSRNI